MNTPPSPDPVPSPQNNAPLTLKTWPVLLHEMHELHARLEYLKLMLKLGVRRP